MFTNAWTGIGPENKCYEDKTNMCKGYSLSGTSTVMTDKSGFSTMSIDATFSWANTKSNWDGKSMEFGWIVETSNFEYQIEKVKYK